MDTGGGNSSSQVKKEGVGTVKGGAVHPAGGIDAVVLDDNNIVRFERWPRYSRMLREMQLRRYLGSF